MKLYKDCGQQWLEFFTWEETIQSLELKYFPNPKNDSEKLFNAQKRFIESQFMDKEAEAELFMLSELVCTRLIRKVLKNRHYTFYSEEEIQDKAGIATDYLVRRYKNDWNKNHQIYYIKDGFITSLQFAVQYALDYVGQEDMLDKVKQLDNRKCTREGIPMTDEEIEEYNKTWQDMEECFALLEITENEEKENEK